MTLSVRFHKNTLCLMNGDEMIVPLVAGSIDSPYLRDPSFLRQHLRRDPTAEELAFWASVIASEMADMIRWWKWSSALREGKITVETP